MALSVLLLSACGQKGPLYLPSATQAKASASPTQSNPTTPINPAQR